MDPKTWTMNISICQLDDLPK